MQNSGDSPNVHTYASLLTLIAKSLQEGLKIHTQLMVKRSVIFLFIVLYLHLTGEI